MIAFLICVAACFPLGSIALDMRRDMVGDRAEAEIARLSAELPPARVSLLPEDWPQPVTPLDLPGIGHTEELAGVELASRVIAPAAAPVVAELRVDGGRHRLGTALGSERQRAVWDTPTGQFWLIVGDLDDPCTHCADPEPGEPAHAGCPGCACPCSMAEVAA